MRDDKYIQNLPDIKSMIREIEKKNFLVTYGWHRDDLKPLEEEGYHLVFFKDDPNYPCMVRRDFKNPDLAIFIGSPRFIDSNGEPIWPW